MGEDRAPARSSLCMMEQQKIELRQSMVALRKGMEPTIREEQSRAAQAVLIGTDWFQAAHHVMLYQAIRGEVGTDLIVHAALAAGKQLCLPRVEGDGEMHARSWDGKPESLVKGPFGIGEPAGWAPIIEPQQIDLIVVPGIAFDAEGYRLGWGGGYYDRYLATVRAFGRAHLVGIGYAFQVVEQLPREPHDVPLDAVATDRGFLRVS
jgi:5-formyltetrahydrofolate cyclo-ligase